MSKVIFLFTLLLVLLPISFTHAGKNDALSNKKIIGENMKTTEKVELTNIPFKTINGQPTSLAAYKGKVILVVNVASKCGFSKLYDVLLMLYRKFKDSGLVVIGFPANNFGGQEPGSDEEILQFCTTKFDVTFPMMSKVSVLGKDKHPLFVQLTENPDLSGEIKWNFTKFLINRDGKLVARFDSAVEPMSDELVASIRKLF